MGGGGGGPPPRRAGWQLCGLLCGLSGGVCGSGGPGADLGEVFGGGCRGKDGGGGLEPLDSESRSESRSESPLSCSPTTPC